MRRPLPLVLVLLLACGVACTHPYLEQKRSQQRHAQRLRPARLEQGEKTQGRGLRTLRLHVYADPDYRAQNQGWRGNLAALVANANQVLGSVFAVRLEIESTDEWSRGCALSDLDACLVELAALDAGAPEVWVLGLVGSMPQLTRHFDDLGRANVPGRHLILRGMSDLDERDGIEQLDRISATQRGRLVRQRREHKATVVLLHEWAHSLGAHHEQEPGWILHAAYDHEQSAFAPATIALIEGMLEPGLAEAPAAEQRERYRRLIEQYGNGWAPTERAAALASLASGADEAARPGRQTGAAAVVAGSTDEALASLSDVDRASYVRAAAHADAGELEQGLPLALDLATRYPQVYPVQHLACGMAMQRGGNMQWIESVCQPALALARQQKP